jgi:exosortase A
MKKEWLWHGSGLALMLLFAVAMFYPTLASMVSIWERSETFAHGFLIFPISLWLIWRIRQELLEATPKANVLALPILVLLCAVWLLATYTGVLVIEQLAVVAMIPVLVFAALGWQATRKMIFPLGFMIFAVPMGEELTPVLINFTADFTVAMVQIVGIPIFREGNHFQLPSGSWSVVSACSGVRYLIASLTLGVLYGYLNYQSMTKRIVFGVVALIVPIIANGLRAFMIVMIGHFSDMQLATGVDHIIYGWIFFGIVIAIMFFIGSYWHDDNVRPMSILPPLHIGDMPPGSWRSGMVLGGAALILVVAVLKGQGGNDDIDLAAVPQLQLVAPKGWKVVNDQGNAWKPDYNGLDREYSAVYVNEQGQQVALYIGYYVWQRQDAELGNYNNVLIAEHDKEWHVAAQNSFRVELPQDGSVPTAVVASAAEERAVAYFYYMNGEVLTDKYETKLLQARAKLLNDTDAGAVIVITTPYQQNGDDYAGVLRQFYEDSGSSIKQAIDGLSPLHHE